jgi:tetratricopeptide (TPR) repeat protein
MKSSALILAAFLIAGPSAAVSADLEGTFNELKEAAPQKDPATVKKLATAILEITVPGLASTAPTDAAEKEEWSKRIAYYRDTQTFAEYALYSTAIQASPEVCLDLLSTLEQRSPKSKYMDVAYPVYFQALAKTGAADKIPAVAESALKNLPDNEDLLLTLAESAYGKKDTTKALNYATRVTTVLSKDTKPEELTDADWQRKRSSALGRANFIAGMIYVERQQHAQANRSLRAALPFIKGNDAMMAPALFYLGVANYSLGTMTNTKAQVLEGARFSEQAAAIKSDLATQAYRNAQAMKDAAAKMR